MKLFYILILVLFFENANAQSTNVYYDSKNNLLWQDTFENGLSKMSFKRALSYCETLEIGYMTNWHIPSKMQAQNLIDLNRIPTVIKNINYAGAGCYWTYTSGKIAIIDFKNGTAKDSHEYDLECYVRCVRNGRK